MSIGSFFSKYFTDPILADSGYNPYNTLAYAVLAIFILYGFYKLFVYLRVKVDIKLFFAALPFIVFGVIMRAFVDHNYFQMTPTKKFLLISPGIWLVSTLLFVLTFTASYFLYKKYSLSIWKITSLVGTLIVIASIGFVANKLAFNQLLGAVIILSIFISLCIVIYLIGKYGHIQAFTDKVCFAAIACQAWDGVNTSTLLSLYGGHEKHFVPRWIIANFGPWSFLLVKLGVLLPSVYLLYKHVKDKALRNTFLIGIAVFGLGEGLRNFVSMLLA